MLTAGCTGQDSAPKLKFGNDVNCNISCSGREYRCTLSFVSEDAQKITMTYPQSVEGIAFGCCSGSNSIALNTLLCRSESDLLPGTSVPGRLREFIVYLKKNREEIKLFPAEGGYKNDDIRGMKIRTDENGTLTDIIN